jgi:PRC-barrel domain
MVAHSACLRPLRLSLPRRCPSQRCGLRAIPARPPTQPTVEGTNRVFRRARTVGAQNDRNRRRLGQCALPIKAAVSNDADHVVLAWSRKEIADAPVVEETDFVSYNTWPQIDGGWDVGISRVLAWPYYPYDGIGIGGIGYPYGYGWGYGWGEPGQATMTYDRVPEGTIEVRRASEVLSSDGHVVGHVDGFLVDPDSKITHLVLDHGHLWGHREVTIPVVDIERAASDAVQLRVTRDVIGEYPSIPFHRHGSAK